MPRDQEMLEYTIPESSETKLDLVKTGGFVSAVVGRLEEPAFSAFQLLQLGLLVSEDISIMNSIEIAVVISAATIKLSHLGSSGIPILTRWRIRASRVGELSKSTRMFAVGSIQ